VRSSLRAGRSGGEAKALADLLTSGHVAAGGFDVFAEEPQPRTVLFNVPNVVLHRHLGAATNRSAENVALQVARAEWPDYLLTGDVTNAPLNMPSVTAEEAKVMGHGSSWRGYLGSFHRPDDG